MKYKKLIILCIALLVFGILLVGISFLIPDKSNSLTVPISGNNISAAVNLKNCYISVKQQSEGSSYINIEDTRGRMINTHFENEEIIISEGFSFSYIIKNGILKTLFSLFSNKSVNIDIYISSKDTLGSFDFTLNHCILVLDMPYISHINIKGSESKIIYTALEKDVPFISVLNNSQRCHFYINSKRFRETLPFLSVGKYTLSLSLKDSDISFNFGK